MTVKRNRANWPFYFLAGALTGARASAKSRGMIDGRQCRAARGLLNWHRTELARRAGASVSTIARLEDGGKGSTLAKQALARVLELAGVEFVTGGARMTGARSAVSAPKDQDGAGQKSASLYELVNNVGLLQK